MRRLGGIDSVENLILLCIPCHRAIHRAESEAANLGVISWVEASCTPLLHSREGWVLLVPDGTFEPLEEGEALRLLNYVNGSAQVA